MANGTTFEKVTRNMVENLKENVDSGFRLINSKLDKIDEKQIELFNHQSGRLPSWATATITILSSLTVGLAVYFLTRGI